MRTLLQYSLSRSLAVLAVVAGLMPAGVAAQSTDSPRREAEAREVDYSTRADVRAFVRELVTQHGFDQDELLKLFAQVRYQARVVSP